MHYYSFNIAAWALHTSHLSLEEEGVYRRLLDHYYDTEAPIPLETKWVIRRLRLGSYEDIVGLILEEFFIKKDDGWHNLRADLEISEYTNKAETARENGKKGGRPKKNKGIETQPVSDRNQEKTGSKANYELVTNNYELPPKEKSGFPFSELKDLYNKIFDGKLNQVRGITNERKKHIRARVGEDSKRESLDWWERYFEVVINIPFLIGDGPPNPKTGRPWKCDLDWLINQTNMTKVLEGKYENE